METKDSVFESFPPLAGVEEEEGALAKLKRLFTSSSSAATTTTAPSLSSAISVAPSGGSIGPRTTSPVASSFDSAIPPPPTRKDTARQSSINKPQPDARPGPIPVSSSQPAPHYPLLPNGRRSVRPIRLSGVTPSVRLTVAHSEKGDLVQSGSSRSIAGDSGFGGDRFNMGGIHGSPTASDSFALNLGNLSSIPGFPLGREGGDDAKSVRSVSSVARPSASVAHIFRRLRGEGLSKDYWIQDESSKECFDCQTVFTAFRRKHHCRICGQIFCSRCASNIISSARFGNQGVVRVCNFCMSVLEDGDAAPDDPGPRFRSGLRDSSPLVISAPLEASARPLQSQYAASQLFPRTETAYNFAPDDQFGRISETSSRAGTPVDYFEDDADRQDRSTMSSPLVLQRTSPLVPATAAAPFRRGLAEDDKGPGREIEGEPLSGLGIMEEGEQLELELETGAPVAEPPPMLAPPPPSLAGGNDVLGPALVEPSLSSPLSPITNLEGALSTEPSPTFPPLLQLSPSKLSDQNLPSGRARSKSQLSLHPITSSSGFIFSELPYEGPGPDPTDIHRILAESGPYRNNVNDAGQGVPTVPKGPIELSPARMEHIRRMLRQSLEREGIPNPAAWEKELVKLLVKAATSLAPNVHGADDLDVRKYVRVKRIPGGLPRHSDYVAGVVFTKNVITKQMARELIHPRIMLVTFPLDFRHQRGEQEIISLDAVLENQRSTLHHEIVAIIRQRPHIVISQCDISRVALDALADNNLVVAKNVKPRVIEALARATQGETASGVGKFREGMRLGRCDAFKVQTFVHSMIPGRRKTFLRFEGCNPELGCTLILRGGTMEVLTKVKRIVKMMVGVVYSAKLESYFVRDEFVDLLPNESSPSPPPVDDPPDLSLNTLASQERERISNEIAASLRPYEETALSGSPFVEIPPPYPLARMAEEDVCVSDLRRLREREETEQIIHEEAASKEASELSISQSASSSSLSSLAPSDFSRAVSLSEKHVPMIADAFKILQTPEDLARISEFAEAEDQHAQQLVLWKAYLEQNHDSFDPADHQQIFVLEASACTQTERLCTSPVVRAITFYGENDLALGKFVEDLCRAGNCPQPGCGRAMLVHSLSWVHGRYRVSLNPQNYAPSFARPEEIVMYGACKICGVKTPQAAMSDETYKLSFGKFLELYFYPKNLHLADHSCDHNPHTDFSRFFTYRGVTLGINVDPIDLRNVVAPPLVLRIKPEKQLQLRNEEYMTILKKSTAFWDSVDYRVSSFKYELVAADMREEARTALKEVSLKCAADRMSVLKLLQKTYEQAQATNGTQMTDVRRALQDKHVEWDAEWTALELKFVPYEKESRRITAGQIKRLFSDGTTPSERRMSTTSSNLAPANELEEKQEEEETPSGGTPLTKEELDRFNGDIDLHSLSSAPSTSGDTNISAASSLLSSPPPFRSHSAKASTTDEDSDSTVCADPTSTTAPLVASPFIAHRQLGDVPEDTSGTESEVERTPNRGTKSGVADLVNFFSDGGGDSAVDKTAGALSAARSPPLARPPLRRGVSDKARSSKPRANDVFSDGDGSGSYARNVGVLHLSQRACAEKPTQIPPFKAADQPTSLADIYEPGDPIIPRRPRQPSSKASRETSPSTSRSVSRSTSRSGRRTPGLSHRAAADGSTITLKGRPALVSTASSKSTTKGKGKESSSRDHEASEPTAAKLSKGKSASSARPTASSINTASSSRRSVSVLSSSGHRVSTIANHFNKITRDADRERQRRMALFGARKRPRPVATAEPTVVRVFDNVKDAVKQHSDDECHSTDGASSGADDEYDDEVDVDGRDEQKAGVRTGAREPSAASSKESYVYGAGEPTDVEETSEPTTSIVDALLLHPATLPVGEPCGTISSASEPSLAGCEELEPPSVPPSPLLADSLSLPRMSEGESSGNERGFISKTISGWFPYRGAELPPLANPENPREHVFSGNDILVREDEPSSILAFVLSSKKYHEKLKENNPHTRVLEQAELFMPDDPHAGDRSSTWGLLDVISDAGDLEETLRKPEQISAYLAFGDEKTPCQFSTTVFFAEQFEALRRNSGCSGQFIESLARCVKWESSGGRSKVDFLKTRDDRFIVKEISRLEMDALTRFAPAYFEYMAKAFYHKLPTLLAKIFGFYRIAVRNKSTGTNIRLDVVVMENLFYERQLTQVFDLKGSTRNRHVQVSKDKPNEVLMDENLVEISYKNPLYVREGSKKFIKEAIFNDSLFLANLNVMDYSLVVGVDSTKGELVVGIVDFIRTFTWDKRVENWVKDSAFLGGGSSRPGGPTIVTPKQYKARFRAAMDGYFLLAPDPWLHTSVLLKTSVEKEIFVGGKTDAPLVAAEP